MLEHVVQKVLTKSHHVRSRRSRILWLLADEFFFLIVAPWLLIGPAHLLCRSWPRFFSGASGVVTAFIAIVLGMAYSLWAVTAQWRQGEGTPSLNAPPQRLVVTGPYRLSRNPIQFGSFFYIMGLGTLVSSVLTGLVAAAVGLTIGIFYIKNVEEKEMRLRFGDEYCTYWARTAFLIPRVSHREYTVLE